MNMRKDNKAVSEVIGAIVLVVIAVSALSTVYAFVLSDSGPSSEALVTIVGKLDANDIVFEHRSGEPLGLNSKVLLDIAGRRLDPLTLNYLMDVSSKENNLWNIGEQLIFSGIDLTGLQVEATIVDEETNSMVMWGVLVLPPLLEHRIRTGNIRFWVRQQDNGGATKPSR